MTTLNLMHEVSTVSAGEWKSGGDATETTGVRSVQVGLLGVGAITATIRISGSNDNRFPITVAEFTLSGSGMVTEATEIVFPWEFFRAEVIAISGTSARASVTMKV